MAARRTVEADWRGAVEMLLDGDGRLFCDSPVDCDVCMLFGADAPEWREQVGQAFQSAPEVFAQSTRRGVRYRLSAADADAEILVMLGPHPLSVREIAIRTGCGRWAVAKRIQAAMQRGAPIVNVHGRGYRLRQEQSA